MACAVVDQVEFKLGRDDGRQALVGIAFDHTGQRMARVAVERATVLVIHPQRQQGRRRGQPRHGDKPALGRVQDAIGIARVKDKGAVVDVFAPDVEVQNGKGETGALAFDLAGKAGGHALASGLTVQIARRDADCADLGVGH